MEFLARLLDTKSPLSSKRFFGGIGFLAAIVFIAIWQHDLINELLYVSASLIGLDTVKSGLTMLKSTKK